MYKYYYDFRLVKRLAKGVYNKKVEACCGHCANAQISSALKLVFCRLKGPVSEGDVCRKFIYDPLKRTPKTAAPLLEFTEEDFSL